MIKSIMYIQGCFFHKCVWQGSVWWLDERCAEGMCGVLGKLYMDYRPGQLLVIYTYMLVFGYAHMCLRVHQVCRQVKQK